MVTKKRVAWLFCPLVFFLMLSCAGRLQGKKAEPERAYTRVNTWFERPDKILSTNYHKGTMIPAGTEVEIVSRGGKKIVFAEVSGLTYTLLHVKRHSTITLDELFDRYFSRENVKAEGGNFSRFTDQERNHINDGSLAVGMSKDAVLMAYGYPPSHKTPSLSDNTWIYWRHRWERVLVNFGEDNRVREIQKAVGP